MRDRSSTSSPRSPLVELTKTRLREFFREPGIVFWVFGFPLLMAIGLGLAFREKPAEAPAVDVVASHDSAVLSGLLESKRIRASRVTRAEAERDLARARVALFVDLDATEPTFHYDQHQPSAELARALTDSVLQSAAGRKDPLKTADQLQALPGTRYIDFLIPGVIGLNVMGSSLWSIGYNLVVARKRKLLRRYAVTPMRRGHFLSAYFLARALFLTLELSVLVSFGALVFGTVPQGSLLLFGALAVVGAGAFAGMGLWVGARGDNTEVAQGWLNFIQLPMWILSGVYFSNDGFPGWMQPVIDALPLTLLVDGFRSIYQGDAWPQVSTSLAGLLAWAAVSFGAAARRFRWQ